MAEDEFYSEDLNTEEGDSSSRFNLLNMLAGLLVLAAICIIGLLVVMFLLPDNFVSDVLGVDRESARPTLAPTAVVPSLTPTELVVELPTEMIIETPTVASVTEGELPPTSTPFPTQPPATPVPINTLRPTLTPSVTPTFPPPTPTRTPTPTPTDTPTPGPSPTATSTRSPFPFTKDLNSPQYLQNFANTAGCNWMGIAGEVFDINGNPVPYGEYRVHIWDSGIDQRVTVGDAPAYGPSGYEQFVNDVPRVQDHNIQLETSNGTAVSQVYRIQTRASCNQNLIFFTFVQNH